MPKKKESSISTTTNPPVNPILAEAGHKALPKGIGRSFSLMKNAIGKFSTMAAALDGWVEYESPGYRGSSAVAHFVIPSKRVAVYIRSADGRKEEQIRREWEEQGYHVIILRGRVYYTLIESPNFVNNLREAIDTVSPT